MTSFDDRYAFLSKDSVMRHSWRSESEDDDEVEDVTCQN